MKIAICSSLQGSPEEFSDDALDCYRLSGYIYNRLADMFPTVDFDLFNRDDFPGQGDAYLQLINAYTQWGAGIAVHIHQDAGGGGGARGWHIIYANNASITLVNELVWALSQLPSPMRYGGAVCRNNVAAVKRPAISVLIEAGFYTSAADEAIGIEGWGDAIVKGVSNYLIRHWGIAPGEEEDNMAIYHPRQMRDNDKGQHVYKFDTAMVGNGWRSFYDLYNEDWPEGINVEVYTSEKQPVIKAKVGWQERWTLDLQAAVGSGFKGSFAVIIKTDKDDPGTVNVFRG
ncbi:MAG TPA: hypothetical protein PKX17_06435 [Candidatus Methanomethylicus sp.]|nr:hypothetical protein [Candidatus Methanomethylicus sp.]